MTRRYLRTLACSLILPGVLMVSIGKAMDGPGPGATADSARARPDDAPQACPPGPKPYQPTPAEVERDNIFSLLAYAVVHKNWQSGGGGAHRRRRLGGQCGTPGRIG